MLSEDRYGPLSLPYLAYEPDAEAAVAGVESEAGISFPGSGRKLLVFLHGSGDRGKSPLELKGGWGLPQSLAKGVRIPLPAICPICPAEDVWRPEIVLRFLDDMAEGGVAAGREILLCGFSMGATGVYAFQAAFPGRIASALIVAGRITRFSAEAMARVPALAIYGDRDPRFRDSEIERRAAEVAALGGRMDLKVLPGKGHYIWDQALALAETRDWLVR